MSKGRRFAYQQTRQTQLHWKKNKRSPAPLWTTWRDSAVINHNFFDARRCDEAGGRTRLPEAQLELISDKRDRRPPPSNFDCELSATAPGLRTQTAMRSTKRP